MTETTDTLDHLLKKFQESTSIRERILIKRHINQLGHIQITTEMSKNLVPKEISPKKHTTEVV